ncbi:MAG: hypothetical protein WC749_00935 [Dehalococcoidia bacterium]|uniref:hypothetical protein n=1 Tax=unclassified Pseudomonas TaxID=196821 RepID=UPI001474746E|nr:MULTISPECIES: hypothetical protein [unclassified Pseudomonas]NMX92498.1 hypothetical protein [Pseudomonas sp. WS 5086]NMY47224.1 hypothetical protein [Pseudomonas sp. WS 5027]
MARKPAPTAPRGPVQTTSYPLWLPNDQFKTIIEAQQKSEKQWPEWIAAALVHFKKEPTEEIEALLGAWVRERKNKQRINVRITKASLEDIETICAAAHNGSKQACLQHALFIHALRTHSNTK